MFICSHSFLVHGTHSGLWHYEFIARLLQGLYKNTYKLKSWLKKALSTRMTTSWGVYENLLVEYWPILCGRKQVFQGPPGTSQRIAARRSSTEKTFRGPQSATCGGVGCDPEDSKINPLVQAGKRWANREPSLVVGRGHVRWSMLGLLALTRQKQLA